MSFSIWMVFLTAQMDSVPFITPKAVLTQGFLAWVKIWRNYSAERRNVSSVPAITTPQGLGSYGIPPTPCWPSLIFGFQHIAEYGPAHCSPLHRISLWPSLSSPNAGPQQPLPSIPPKRAPNPNIRTTPHLWLWYTQNLRVSFCLGFPIPGCNFLFFYS